MKQFLLGILLLSTNLVYSREPGYRQKLYYTGKIWGFVKYFHSEVSVCKVNWDSVLFRRLPAIKAAATAEAFNRELDSLLQAAGPMARATTPALTAIAPEFRRNLDLGWQHDPLLSPGVQAQLDTIRIHFRPHASCWVNYNDYSTANRSYLIFPHDSLMYPYSTATNFPGEEERTLLLFRYWNIISYFNPYNYVLDHSWDSTLYQKSEAMVGAATAEAFYLSFRQITKELDDAHVEGFTSSRVIEAPQYYYGPKIVLRYVAGHYIVVKSGVSGMEPGHIIDSVDGISVADKELALRPYISAGNPAVLHRMLCRYLLNGRDSSMARISFTDNTGTGRVVSTLRHTVAWTGGYYPNGTLAAVHWKQLGCNIGYVHMGNLQKTELDTMYQVLGTCDAIIFDIRNYPNGTLWQLVSLLFPDEKPIARFWRPDIQYPGTFAVDDVRLGTDHNPRAYKGKVIILANEQTQSHAEYTCMGLKAMSHAVVVGSQTAGADGNLSSFNLARDLGTGFTTLGTYYPNGDSTQRIGIVPDIPVQPTRAGIIAGRDEVLEKALQVAGCRVPGTGRIPVGIKPLK